MIIDSIEYNILLFVDDENGESVEEFYFENFEKYNEFVRERKKASLDRKYVYSYTFVEMVNNEPEPFSWTLPIELDEVDETLCQKMIQDYREWQAENDEHWEKVDKFSKEIHYNSDGIKHKKTGLEDYCYACPTCLNVVEDCECALYPGYLVQIDRLMLPIIKELNSKGYRTTSCCAEHPSNDSKFMCIYISFAEDYDFDFDIPEGAKYSKLGHTVKFSKEVNGYTEALQYQQECLDKFSDWAELLFDVDEFIGDDEDIDE